MEWLLTADRRSRTDCWLLSAKNRARYPGARLRTLAAHRYPRSGNANFQGIRVFDGSCWGRFLGCGRKRGQRQSGVRSCCLTKECYPTDCCRFGFFSSFVICPAPSARPPRFSTFAQLTLRLAHQRTFARNQFLYAPCSPRIDVQRRRCLPRIALPVRPVTVTTPSGMPPVRGLKNRLSSAVHLCYA
jgi:hypothetical protein